MVLNRGVVPIVGFALVGIALAGCSSSSVSRSAAGVSAAPQVSTSTTPVALVAPETPRSTYKIRGHVVTLELKPDFKSAPVKYYEATVVKRGEVPIAGKAVETCDGELGSDGSVTCRLNYLKRGNWDVFVRAVNDAGSSDWYQGASATIDSCTQVDGLAGACEAFDKGPGGGFVFYDAGKRESWGRYLEAAPVGWSGESSDPWIIWCPEGNTASVQGAVEDALGTGAANTAVIIDTCGNDTAAGRASQYRGGGLADWFLPSYLEAKKMESRRSEVGLNTSGYGIGAHRYWSSSAYDAEKRAMAAAYDNGRTPGQAADDERWPFASSRTSTAPVRPIRVF